MGEEYSNYTLTTETRSFNSKHFGIFLANYEKGNFKYMLLFFWLLKYLELYQDAMESTQTMAIWSVKSWNLSNHLLISCIIQLCIAISQTERHFGLSLSIQTMVIWGVKSWNFSSNLLLISYIIQLYIAISQTERHCGLSLKVKMLLVPFEIKGQWKPTTHRVCPNKHALPNTCKWVFLQLAEFYVRCNRRIRFQVFLVKYLD